MWQEPLKRKGIVSKCGIITKMKMMESLTGSLKRFGRKAVELHGENGRKELVSE